MHGSMNCNALKIVVVMEIMLRNPDTAMISARVRVKLCLWSWVRTAIKVRNPFGQGE